MISVTVDEDIHEAAPHERLIDLFNRSGVRVPHVCYHPRLGPIQTCDTCLVEVWGKLVRACATQTSDGMVVSTRSSAAKSAQRAAFDRILGNHLLYCTVCDNNNGNCTVHNTTKLLAVRSEEHTSELQSRLHLVCRLLLEKKKKKNYISCTPY